MPNANQSMTRGRIKIYLKNREKVIHRLDKYTYFSLDGIRIIILFINIWCKESKLSQEYLSVINQ